MGASSTVAVEKTRRGAGKRVATARRTQGRRTESLLHLLELLLHLLLLLRSLPVLNRLGHSLLLLHLGHERMRHVRRRCLVLRHLVMAAAVAKDVSIGQVTSISTNKEQRRRIQTVDPEMHPDLSQRQRSAGM